MKLNSDTACTPRLTLAFLALTLLAGCGGSSSGLTPGANNNNTQIQETDQNVQNTDTTPQINGGLVSPPVNENNLTDTVSPPVITPPLVTPADETSNNASDVQTYGLVANLFGNAVFSFSYFDSGDIFFLDVDWGAESAIEADEDSYILFGSGRASTLDTEDTLTEAGSRDIFCSALFDTYFCSISVTETSIVYLLFDQQLDTGTQNFSFAQSGVMEYCEDEAESEACIAELLASPDGTAVLTVQGSISASPVRTASSNTIYDEFAFENRLGYLEQGTATFGQQESPNSPKSQLQTMILNRLNAIGK